MTSIHEEGAGSAQSERDGLAIRLEQLENVLAVAGVGYCRIDSETRGLQASTQFKAEFGFPPDALLDWETLLQRVAVGQRDGLADMLHSGRSDAADLQLLVQSVWPDGSSQWIALRGRAIHALGATLALILTSQNVTAEQQSAADQASQRSAVVERERRLRAGAEAANRGKDQFLSVFSHELRSPLNAILGWNRILALKRAGDSEVTSITARIEHSARAQLKMVNDLLDLGRIETGKLRIEARPMQLAKVAAAAVDLARPAAAAKGITLTADFAPGAGQLRGDPDRLQQVVANLLSNAVKFTSSGGEIRVTLRTHQSFSELTVQDSGQGIAPELLPHVFDRFRQGDTSSTRSTGGLGLGLALVREIVHLHGGTVSARSPGRGFGASFLARFPNRQPWKSDAAPAEGLPAATTSDTLRGLSILVVDDEPDARIVVAETLRLEGARVTVTDSAMAAYAKIQENDAHFDIIVTDIGMPEEDGYSLVRRVRGLQSGRQILAIAMTGYASKGDVQAAMDAGFDLHVPKPLDFDTFVPLVRRLAHGEG